MREAASRYGEEVRLVVLLTLTFAVGVSASASAAVVDVVTFAQGPLGLPVTQVRYTAAPGERNAISVSAAQGIWNIRDAGARVQAGAGCALVDAHTARCANPTPAYIALGLVTGDRADTVSVPEDVPNTLVDAGAGDDVLRGGENAGFTGGTGSDRITLTGEDPPRSVHCGRGTDLVRVLAPRGLQFDRDRIQTCERLRVAAFVVAVKPDRRRRALVMPARCVASGPCRGLVSLSHLAGTGRTTVLGNIEYRLKAGQRRTLRLSLSRSERRLVAQPSGRLNVRLQALSGSDPNTRDVRWRVRIKR